MKQPMIEFEGERATTYDERYQKMAPLKDCLHLLADQVFASLPEEARVLVVAAGTGAELLYLAERHPEWTFTAVEPSKTMMSICREKCVQAGVERRIDFHNGYLQDLPQSQAYHGATSFLVSHFLLEADERRAFFRQIAHRLHPGGPLVNADLTHLEGDHQNVMALWLKTMTHAGHTLEQLQEYEANLKRAVSLVSDAEMKALLVEAGFQAPTRFLQTALISAWFAQRV